MKVIENRCCDCASSLYPCQGDICDLKHYEAYYCDECGEEEILYNYDCEELCLSCIEKRLEKANGD